MSEDKEKELPAPLRDIVEIAEERPNLSQDEWDIVTKALPYIKAQLKPEVRQDLEVEYAKKMAAELENLKIENKRIIDEQFAAMKKAQEPLGEDEVKKLLSQE